MSNICYIIIIGNEKPQMWFAELNVKNTSKSSKLYRCVFLLVNFLLTHNYNYIPNVNKEKVLEKISNVR